MIKNAPHLVRNQAFIVPNYDWWEALFYGIGMKIYDLLAGKLRLGRSKILSLKETVRLLPALKQTGLRGGVIYHDGQFDDSRLAINLAQTAVEHGATLINYAKVTALIKPNRRVEGVLVKDHFSGEEFKINGRAVINATGVFTDEVVKMDDPKSNPTVVPSQGIHLVLDKEFLPGESALMVPNTDDGRVLFAVPWNGRLVVGTTDTQVEQTSLEPKALEKEIEFILSHVSKYLTKSPTRNDVRSVFTGLRPLVKSGNEKKTASLSRDHTLIVSESGLVTITGGKWTTYRKMAQDTIDLAAKVAGLISKDCITENLKIHGWLKDVNKEDPLYYYGSDKIGIDKIIEETPDLGIPLHRRLPYLKAEVIWSVRNEMAMTVEDILARRTHALLLDAKASVETAPEVAKLMAAEMNKDEAWQKQQLLEYEELSRAYILEP
jgi:glycerol-3-phosphate dehydrogenase